MSELAKIVYLVRDGRYREILACLAGGEVMTTGDVVACLADNGVDVSLSTLKNRLRTLVELGVVETNTVLRKKVWMIRKSLVKALQKALDREQQRQYSP